MGAPSVRRERRLGGTRIYKSIVDTWFKVMVAMFLGVPIVLGFFTGPEIWPVLLISAFWMAFVVWLYAATKYEITGDALIIHAGLYKRDIPVRSITSVKDSRSAMASPAFSLDRLEIQYGAGKVIFISPKDKAGFLADLDLHEFDKDD